MAHSLIQAGNQIRGRGAVSNGLSARFDDPQRAAFDDGWSADDDAPSLKTTITFEASRSIISRNRSPDIPFDRSVNAYRGCEHGCVYCYARPSHAYLGLSPGLDFESRLFAKPDAAKLLERELSAKNYSVRPIAMGTNTDPYQPIERRLGITREIITVLERSGHPFTIVTKSHLVVRDLDLLARAAGRNLVKVYLSVTTLKRDLARIMEPRAATPARRLAAVSALRGAGVPVGVMLAPMIPAINDDEIEWIIAAAADAGAGEAAHMILRLPHELKQLFAEWLRAHFPDRAQKVLHQLEAMHGGRLNDPRFGHRMRGEGAYAAMIAKRMANACRRHGLNRNSSPLSTAHFRGASTQASGQLSLF